MNMVKVWNETCYEHNIGIENHLVLIDFERVIAVISVKAAA